MMGQWKRTLGRVLGTIAFVLIISHFFVSRAHAEDAVYQYAATSGARTAYLWVPAPCAHVRGVIVAFSNLLERRWLEDPLIRATARKQCLGELWVGPGKGSALNANMNPAATAAFEQLMVDLAATSGFAEIASAPVIATGHSANGNFAWNFARALPQRTIAAVAIKTSPLPTGLDLPGIPFLYMVGETTEWPQYKDGRPGDRDYFWPVVRESALRMRGADDENLIGVVTDPGGGHFDWSSRQAALLALFLEKACNMRLPMMGVGGAEQLRPVRAAQGWLTDTHGVQPETYPAAPYAAYAGDKSKAYWFFDREMAEAASRFNGDRKLRKRQMLTFEQDGALLPVAKLGFAPLQFEPEADGVTFTLQPRFLPAIPGELIGAGTALGHANGRIHLSLITGMAEQSAPNKFRLAMHRGDADGVVWIQEEQEGNAEYRKAVQPGQMHIPVLQDDGKPQTIEFDPIPDQAADTKRVQLHAVANSGLPVRWYVEYGPAQVQGDVLVMDEVPQFAGKAIDIKVVAYQWGLKGSVASAPPVARTFRLLTAAHPVSGTAAP
ncbi:MAG TPA: hypothetical protein VGN16_11905 [Acidobacteriaceae bacterium]|jgi:pimeloyl-ACP methyl ester carboxylesterase